MASTNSRDVLRRLAARTSRIDYAELTVRGQALTQVAFIDTLGVGLAGASASSVRIAGDVLSQYSARGSSLVLGGAIRTSALDAALLNGIGAHALDYDDGNSVMGGHPSVLLVPALLALAEERGATTQDVMVAYAAGYEVIIRLSGILNPHHYEKGWHPTSTIGVFGVAAGAARLLKLDAEKTGVALALAASMASGLKANFGTMAKALHVGHAARDGLTCALLAERGFTANPGCWEAAQGFLVVYNGASSDQVDQVLSDLDTALEANRQVNSIKLLPCCASTHSAVEAAKSLHQMLGSATDAIERIEIAIDPMRMPHTNRPRLQEALSGKFSQQYVVARALAGGAVGLEHFEADAHLDPVILQLMAVSDVRASTEGPPNSFAASVAVTLKNGSRFSHRRDVRDGRRAPEDYLSSQDLWTKFSDCAERAIDPTRVLRLVAALERFPELGDIANLTDLMASPPHAHTRDPDQAPIT